MISVVDFFFFGPKLHTCSLNILVYAGTWHPSKGNGCSCALIAHFVKDCVEEDSAAVYYSKPLATVSNAQSQQVALFRSESRKERKISSNKVRALLSGPDETDYEIHLSPIGKLGFLWSSHYKQLFLIISCSALVETIHISTCVSNDTECVTICQYCWIVRPCGSTRLNTTNNIWEGDDVLTVINACLYTLACMLSITHNSVAFLDI